MIRRGLLAAVLLASVLLPAEGAPPPARRFPFWACSDGRGTVSLFWLPPGGRWPAGGYRLERVSRGRTTVLGARFRPGQDARPMMELEPADADAIRSLADKIERGTLTDEERSRSVSLLGRAASADAVFGRALGVRYTDVPRTRGKLVYRLTALDADGTPGSTMESAEVDPARATPAPRAPEGLRAEEQAGGVALFWSDPPASPVAPVVAYRVDRGDGGRRMAALNGKPLVLDRHLRRGKPEFVDAGAPAKKLNYEVRSIDVFGRVSAPVRVAIAVKEVARPEAPAAQAKAPAAAPAAEAAGSPRIATAPSAAAGPRRDTAPEAGAGVRSPGVPALSTTAKTASITRKEAAPQTPAPTVPLAPSAVSVSASPGGPAPAPEAAGTVARGTANAEPAGPPPPPEIVGIAGTGGRVVVRFRPGEPADLTREFVVLRSESPTGAGTAVGRPLPGDAREWQDTTVSAGRFFWYRLVAVDGAGNRSEPSKPKWVSTGSR